MDDETNFSLRRDVNDFFIVALQVMGLFSDLSEKIKRFFDFKTIGTKKVKFFALIFVIIVLLYLAVSPLPSGAIETVEEVGNFSFKSLGKRVRFAENLVTDVWH